MAQLCPFCYFSQWAKRALLPPGLHQVLHTHPTPTGILTSAGALLPILEMKNPEAHKRAKLAGQSEAEPPTWAPHCPQLPTGRGAQETAAHADV